MLVRYAHEILGLARSAPPLRVLEFVGKTILEAPVVLTRRNLASVDRRIRGPVDFRTWRGLVTLDCSHYDAELPFDSSSAFGLAREIYCRNVYLRAFRQFDANGAAVVDFGGNRGLATTLLAEALQPDCVVYVEPDKRYRYLMEQLVGEHAPAARIIVLHGFMGASPDDGEVINPDSALPDERIAFLKMDIEGAEEPLLRGAGAWLDRVERIAMESHPQWCSVEAVVGALEERGFVVRPTNAVGHGCEASRAGFVYAARDPSFFV